MIFSSFFKSKNKWQSKDSTIRITAINDELSAENTEQRQVLLDLLNHDESDLVRRAALIKLNHFSEYLSASENNDQIKIKAFASKQVEKILMGQHELQLSSSEKLNIIETETLSGLYERWLQHESNADVVMALFTYVNNHKISKQQSNQQLIFQTFSHKQNSQIQTFLLGDVNDLTLLEKLHKKSANETVSHLISTKINTIESEREKPIKVRKHVGLLLAKLLALKEVAHYEVYLDKRATLNTQWQESLTQQTCLPKEEQEASAAKFAQITTQLDKLFVSKAESYQQEKIAKKLQQDKDDAKASFSSQLNELDLHLTTAVFESETVDQDAITNTLEQLQHEIVSSVLNDNERNVFEKQISQLTKKLAHLPQIAESVSQATHLISRMSQLTLPQDVAQLNEKQTVYNDWLHSWQEVEKKSEGVLPTSILDAYQVIVKNWQDGLKPLQQQQKQQFFQVKKKLTDISRLLAHGKYKVCFGLFKGVEQHFDLLSPNQQQQLQRDYAAVNEKMSDISDWEHYIATPRKQELLTSIQALVNTPLDNLNDQAKQVKQYRKTWNSLGHADEDIDQQLNEDFNNACELAFAPCRAFYAEQEEQRAQHLMEREAMIKEAQMLANEVSNPEASIDFKVLDGQLNKLQQRWQSAGEVDRTLYKSLQDSFQQSLKPIKLAIKNFHESNTLKKQKLIEEAEKALSAEDVFNAVETVKQLQKNWRDVGYAGSHKENKLWKSFRSINDQLFAKRDEVKTAQQSAQMHVEQAFTDRLSALKQFELDNAQKQPLTKQQLKQLLQQVNELSEEVLTVKPSLKKLSLTISQYIKHLDTQLSEQLQSEQKISWQRLFQLLTRIAQESLTKEQISQHEDFAYLTPFWQKRVQEAALLSEHDDAHRADKTIEIEVLGQVNTPEAFASQRMAIQVKLMQSQMLSGQKVDLTQRLAEWLQLGKLTPNDIAYITRLQAVYC